MEKNKYYTPEIEEFCVGFEYETTYLKSVWTKEVLYQMDCGWFFESYINDAVETEFRVKCLDEQDILDLGFTFFGENNKNLVNSSVNMYHNDELNLMLGHYYNLGQIVIATKDPSKNETFNKTGQDPNRTGFLKIKNKTELIKLLKQLNINHGIQNGMG